jgi:hypothetical protein
MLNVSLSRSMWSTMHPMVAKSSLPIKSCICILRVEIPDGSYMLVPANEDEGAGGDVHYVTVEQDPDQSPEVGVSACADEGKPRFNH